MALTQNSLELGRVGLKKVYWIIANGDEAKKQYKDVVGQVDDTTQTFERYKQLAGLTPAVQTGEGAGVDFDDPYQIFTKDFYPVKFTKGMKMSVETTFTDQYNKIKNRMPLIVEAFMHRKNIHCADLDNTGFTDTSRGVNSETLYTTSHSMGNGNTFSNRPATDIALGPLAAEQCITEIRKQKQARNQPMPYTGKICVKVPVALEGLAYRLGYTNQLIGTNNNDVSFSKTRMDFKVIDYYTSDTAWFARVEDNAKHGLFLLEQMPFDITQLPLNEQLQYSWVAYESYIAGWYDAHGTWGTTGA